jgi:hypothetical protein
MTQQVGSGSKKEKPLMARFSLDAWALAFALLLSLLVWIGLIKHVPW